MADPSKRSRWIAIVTGAISVMIGLVYLLMITLLDARGPMRPPPPEALVAAAVAVPLPVEGVQSPVAWRRPGTV